MTSESADSLVERILTGECQESSQEVQALLDANPGLREELAEMRFLQEILVQDSEAIREVISTGEGTPELGSDVATAPGPTSMATAIAPEPRPRSSVSWQNLVATFVAVAAALVLFFQGPWLDHGESGKPKRGDMLGGQILGIADVTPEGAGQSFKLFRYSISASGYAPTDLRSELSVWAHDAVASSAPLYTTHFIGTEWTPSKETRDSFPDEIRWQIKVSDKSMGALDVVKVPYAAR